MCPVSCPENYDRGWSKHLKGNHHLARLRLGHYGNEAKNKIWGKKVVLDSVPFGQGTR